MGGGGLTDSSDVVSLVVPSMDIKTIETRSRIRTELSKVGTGKAFVQFYEKIPAAIKLDRAAFKPAPDRIEPGK